MTLKLFGALLLVCGSVLFAMTLNRRLEYILYLAEGWIELVGYVKNQVECYSLPIDAILRGCDGALLLRCGYYSDITPVSLEELVTSSRRGDSEIDNTVGSFCAEFGRFYRDEQVRRCRYCLSMLEARRDVLREQLPVRKRINLTLFAALSLIVAIIVL